jgi:hypothetical protein
LARADAVLDFWALLHRKVVIRSLVLEDPEVNLVSDPDGPWNFENSEPKNSKSTSPGHHRERGDESGAIGGPWVVSGGVWLDAQAQMDTFAGYGCNPYDASQLKRSRLGSVS